jgi:SAM-dependent methyltransferase
MERVVPYPPIHLANRVSSLERWSDPYAAYDRLGAEQKAALLGLLPDDWGFRGKRILDFGCGAGRTLRQFLDEARLAEIWGVDLDAESVRWMEQNLSPPLHVLQGPAAPPLSFESASIDLAWALSVFTHLTDTSLAWLHELHRVLRPDGLLIATYMGRWNSTAFFPEPWDEDLVGMNVLRPDREWELGGPMVLMSDWWVRAHWGRAFDFVEVRPEVHGQTWVLLRKRDVLVSVEDLERLEDDPRELRALRHNVVQVARDERRALADMQAEWETSSSWRVTAPLRQLAALLRRIGSLRRARNSD